LNTLLESTILQNAMIGQSEQSFTELGALDAQCLGRLIAATGAFVYDLDLATDRIAWPTGIPPVLGIEDAGALATAAAFLSHVAPDDLPVRKLALEAHLNDNEPYSCTYKFRRPDGGSEWLHETGLAVRDDDDRPVRFLGQLHIVTAERSRQQHLEQLAYFDPLTGHLNRTRVSEVLRESIEDSIAHDVQCGFLIVNIDNLGLVNEAHGFTVADEVIKGLSRCIERQLREGDLIARIGGNQFGVVLPESGPGAMAGVAESILSAVRASIFQTTAGPIAITVSLGGVTIPDWAKTVANVFGHAEEALSQAKQAGRDCFVEHNISSDRMAQRRRTMATGDKVVAALKDRRLKLAFQPIVAAATGETVMHECLVRMIGDGGEVLPAGQFMSVVEHLGLVRLVDRRCMELAIKELNACPDLNLTVNISGMTATDSNSLANLYALLKANAGVAERLTLEITETVAMQDIRESAWFIFNFRELGCGVALDDFGAGYTSFRHLQNLAVDMVKIDGQFVRNVATDPDNQLFVRTLLELAHGFGLKTVAECVEIEPDAEALRRRRVDYLQGYLYGKPTLEPPWRKRPAAAPLATAEKVA
jgi:diguanylate cyclase (GGDEF)-like protein